jgi:hypothetical protein
MYISHDSNAISYELGGAIPQSDYVEPTQGSKFHGLKGTLP